MGGFYAQVGPVVETLENEAAIENLRQALGAIDELLHRDATLSSAFSTAGLQIPAEALTTVDGASITGDINAAQMEANITEAWHNGGPYDAGLLTGDLDPALLGDIPAESVVGVLDPATYSGSLVATWNSLTGYNATRLTLGDLATARMQQNAVPAINAGPAGVIDASHLPPVAPGGGGGSIAPDTITALEIAPETITAAEIGPDAVRASELGVTAGTKTNERALVPNASGVIDTIQFTSLTVTGAATITNTAAALALAAHASATLGFFAATPVVRQTVLALPITNNLTDPGGIPDQNIFADYAFSTYATDGPKMRVLLWQITNILSKLVNGQRAYGFVN